MSSLFQYEVKPFAQSRALELAAPPSQVAATARPVGVLRQTLSEFLDDRGPTFAASLAYSTAFSIAPVLIIAMTVASTVFGAEAARGEIHSQLEGLVGVAAGAAIEQMMAHTWKSGEALWPTVLGVAVLVFASTGAFAELQAALNVIWKVERRTESAARSVLRFLRTRFLSFAMVLGIGFVLLVSLVMSAALAGVGKYVGGLVPGWEISKQVGNLALELGVITVLFAMIFKVLPDTEVTWNEVWLGAAVSAVLFSVGKFAIGQYLGKSALASGYGAAGALAVLLLWVYYSSMLVLLGAEFSQVAARLRRSPRLVRSTPEQPLPTP